ncbi:MAG: D-alanyl-D-alanine carboxypeptidase [Thermoleophilaceae bacterium]|nr:D-alanyl-D-alanine carboxypeptidase [Thermoleophilaceae bacterium]
MTSPLTGGRERRDSRRRVGMIAASLVFLVVAVGVALVAVDAGRDFARRLDNPTVVTTGMPSSPPVPPPDQRASLGPAVTIPPEDSVRPRLEQPPRAGMLFDLEKGEALWSRRPRDVVPIASLTKIMSALIVVERTSAREKARVTKAALRYSGSGVGVLPRGRPVPVEALLHGMLLVSGNDAAIALADHIAGSERAFVELMNRRAAKLGLRCTHFRSAYGLEGSDRSCAADVAALTRLALEEPRIARVARKREAAIRFPIAGGKLFLNSTNPLLRLRYKGTIGLKTGYTERAGRTYVGVVRRRGRTLGVVLLDSPDTGGQAKRIFDSAFRAVRGRARARG